MFNSVHLCGDLQGPLSRRGRSTLKLMVVMEEHVPVLQLAPTYCGVVHRQAYGLLRVVFPRLLCAVLPPFKGYRFERNAPMVPPSRKSLFAR